MATDITKIKPQILIQDEGVDLTRRDIIDFVGAGVTATDDALNNKTIVTIPGGGATGIWGIADATGTYTYYSDLGTAIAAATSGDVIVLFTNYTETVSSSVFYKNGVNINLNGHTYEYAVADINDTLSDGGLAATVTIFNGTLKRTNSSAPTNTTGVCLKVSNASSNVTLQGVNVIAEDGSNACIIQGGILRGGYFRQIGAVAGSTYGFQLTGTSEAINVNVHSDTKQNRIDTGTVKDSYFRGDGDFGLNLQNGAQAYNCTGYSTAAAGLITNGLAFNCTGISIADRGIDTAVNGELRDCTGYSTASAGIQYDGEAFNCKGYSTAGNGILAISTACRGYNNIAYSTAGNAYTVRGNVVKCSAISTATPGNAFNNNSSNSEIVDCYAEVADAASYGINAVFADLYVVNLKGKGMTTLLNINSNLQVNTEDNFGNILIG